MAKFLGPKIIRIIKVTKVKYLHDVLSFSSQAKPKYDIPCFKAQNTLIQNKVKAGQNENQRAIPIIPSKMKDNEVVLRRKFAKSSTHSALTQPLKLPRLANPFPDPVKTLRSDTVSDEEKARLMEEQIKMEARFHLQMQQEMQLKSQNDGQTQNFSSNNNNYEQQNPVFNSTANFNNPQNKKQPIFRKPKSYDELAKEANEQLQRQNQQQELQQEQQQKQQQQYGMQVQQCNTKPVKKFALNIPKKFDQQHQQMQSNNNGTSTVNKFSMNSNKKSGNDKEQKEKAQRCGRKSHTRAARYLRHSWYPRHYRNRQMREYSTMNCHLLNPEMKSETERCDMIIKALKQAYPEEYKTLRKPVLIPGSPEEKEFIDNILKLLAKHKISELNVKKNKAPFPSYSEVKTFVSDVKGPEKIPNNNNSSKENLNNNTFSNGSMPRYYSTRNQIETKNLSRFSLNLNPTLVKTNSRSSFSLKQEAPYPSYSEVYTKPVTKKKHKTFHQLNSKNYSTKVSDIEAKKKPPCKNPFKHSECDYAKTIKKKDENKKKKHCPKDKKCEPDSSKIISKLKDWFSTYKPESSNIKVCRSPIDVDGQETYVVEVNDYVEVNGNQKPKIIEINQTGTDSNMNTNYMNRMKAMPFKNVSYKPFGYRYSHLPEMTDNVRVLTKNIPDFVSTTEELVQNKEKQDTISKFKYVKDAVEFSAKQIKVNQIQNENTEVEKPVVQAKIDINMDKIKEILDKPKSKVASQVNVVKKNFIVKYNTTENLSVNTNTVENQIKPEMHYNSVNKSQPLKIPMTGVLGLEMSPGCDDKNKDVCKKKEKEECPPKKKCRPIKKRKPPKCDDVKGNKSCHPGVRKPKEYLLHSMNPPVSQIQNTLEYMKNQAEKENFKKHGNINDYIDLKPKIEILANQETSNDTNYINEPFKLKQQFWKK